MNALRIKVLEGRGDALKVRSSIDRTHALSATSDERMLFDRDDVVVLKNHDEAPARLLLTGLDMDHGGTILSPSRQPHLRLMPTRDVNLTLGAGESVTFRTAHAQDPKGTGAVVPT